MSQEDTAVNTSVDEATTPTEAPTDETKELKVVSEGDPVDPGIQPADEPEETDSKSSDDSDESDETKDDTEGTESDEKPLSKKAENRFQSLANENKHLKEYISKLRTESDSEPYDVNRAVDERGLTPEQARIEALEYDRMLEKQEREADRQNQAIQELNVGVRSDMEAVERDFGHLVEDEAQAEELVATWEQLAGVKYLTDEQGELLSAPDGAPLVGEANFSFYDFVSRVDQFGNQRQRDGEAAGQKAAEKKLSAVEVPPSRPSKAGNREDSSLSADEYAKKYNLKLQR